MIIHIFFFIFLGGSTSMHIFRSNYFSLFRTRRESFILQAHIRTSFEARRYPNHSWTRRCFDFRSRSISIRNHECYKRLSGCLICNRLTFFLNNYLFLFLLLLEITLYTQFSRKISKFVTNHRKRKWFCDALISGQEISALGIPSAVRSSGCFFFLSKLYDFYLLSIKII